MSTLPTPADLGFSDKFPSWRETQEDSIWAMAEAEERFVGLVAPTGMGKSAAFMAYSILSEPGRVCILTSTKSQQDQILEDFGHLRGFVDVRGRSNYPCEIEPGLSVEEGPCHEGFDCDLKKGGCIYYDRVRLAGLAPIVLTNYSFWLASNAFGQGIGKFDLLICDEAHAVPDELAGFLSITLRETQTRSLLRMELPRERGWHEWAVTALRKTEQEIHSVTTHNLSSGTRARDGRAQKLKRLAGKLALLINLGERSWTFETINKGVRWDVTNPGPLAERYLFRDTPKVVLSSATVRKKTLDLLGVEGGDATLLEYPSSFPLKRRPVYVLSHDLDGRKMPRLNFRATFEQREPWRRMIDHIVGERLDRRGIIHTVSYGRARELFFDSQHSDHMLLHDPGSEGLQHAIGKYLGKSPAVLLSPAATTGLDFPRRACEYQVVAKIPFPDMRSKVLRARTKIDPDYASYVAMQTMVQASGRGMRSGDDQCEVFLVDGLNGWFLHQYWRFAPRWWRQAVQWVRKVPQPPRVLEGE